jgi:decaprenyl-phosphate phosphoribosyltransferase
MIKKLVPYYRSLRTHQWLKNLLLLFPPFFGGKILDQAVLTSMLPSMLAFSFAASCGYIINDIKDRKHDSRHAAKRHRPIARGDVSPVSASIFAAALFISAMFIAGSVSARFEAYVVLYLFISLLYSLYFKNMVIIDIFFVAFGFFVRVKAGGVAFNVEVTKWLFLTVFIVALFLATGKRLGELIVMGEDAQRHRRSLHQYSTSFIEGTLWFCASAALVTYALYTIENTGGMFYTVPLVTYGLLRYIYIVKDGKGDPTDALLKDGQIMATGIVWLAMIGGLLYRR